ncbi:MAG: DEAD/DEAH box helicase [Sphingomonas sp.]|nr:DEAD/DEAH box helicase [Sphingomonas sp.]
MSFTTLGLSKPVLDALEHANYTVPTPIQLQAIPTLLTGRDLLGIAQTGTGKTAAFVLPSLDRLAANREYLKPGQIRMLVLAPTRELAAQIASSARAYGKFMKLSVGTIYGGVPNHKSVREVARGLDVLVATPGRLLDLIDQRALSLRELEILVLDEADQMLDLGFIHALKRIVALVPAKRQTLFFSATMPRAIKELADRYLTDPAEVSVTPVASTVERVEQRITFVNQSEKAALLTMILQQQQIERALVFSRTKHGADKIVRQLAAAGIASSAIHGNKSQPQRERAIAMFRSGQMKVLIATDIAARGIDVPGVSHVINLDLPEVPEQYVHRIGRTARAGATGIAISFCAHAERGNLRDIERLTRIKLAVEDLPAGFAAAAEAIKRLKPAPGVREERPRHGRGPSRSEGRLEGRSAPRSNDRSDGGQRRYGSPSGKAVRRDVDPRGGSVYRPEGRHERPVRGDAPAQDRGERQPRRDFTPRTDGERQPRRDFTPRTDGERQPRRDFTPRADGERQPRREFTPRTDGERQPRRDFAPRGDRPARADGQRHPQRANGHPAHRTDGGQRPSGGPRPTGHGGAGRPAGNRPNGDRPSGNGGFRSPKRGGNSGGGHSGGQGGGRPSGQRSSY